MKKLIAFSFIVALLQGCVVGVDYDDYDYGDSSIQFDSVHKEHVEAITERGRMSHLELPIIPLAVRGKGASLVDRPPLPLCCPENEISSFDKCVPAPRTQDWRPRLDGAPSSVRFKYQGFPKCRSMTNRISVYQSEVHFQLDDASVMLPFYVQLESIKPGSYCITKISQEEQPSCEMFETQIFACINENESTPTIVFTSVSIAHILLLLTILVFIFMREYKCLQRRYMVCFLVSLLIYNLCLFPGSSSSINVGTHQCIAFGAVKYFFFCGTFLWYKVICFDVLQTIQRRCDLACLRRFLWYSLFCWLLSTILAATAAALPYASQGISENSRNDPMRDTSYENCKLNMGVDMILQMAQSFSMVIDLVLLAYATYCLCVYNRYANGLRRCDVSNCLILAWKIYLIMVAQVLSSVDPNFLTLPVPMWQFVLIESIAVFGVLTYRKCVMQWLLQVVGLSRWLPSETEDGSLQEKGQFTMN